MNLKYNNEVYYYIKNGQNDIIGILDNNYNKIVEYIYDSWGNILEIKDNSNNNIGIINPFRYRSYYYDNETKLYYLNSRYYNPLWGRFINCDGIINDDEIVGCNLYTYCNNNAITLVDPTGESGVLSLLGIAKVLAPIVVYGALGYAGAKVAAPVIYDAVSRVGAAAKTLIGSINISKPKEKVQSKAIAIPNTNSQNFETPKFKPCTEAKLFNGDVLRGDRLTIDEAYYHVLVGNDVMCDNRYYAYEVAKKFKYHLLKPEIDKIQIPGNKYYYHYHPDRNSHRHIWYY